MRNPFVGNKFLWQGIPYIEKLLGPEWHTVPPITVEIDPTNACDNNCVWCMFHDFRKTVPKSIGKQEMRRIIGEIAGFGVKAVTFTGGGEPLCNDHVFPDAFYKVVDVGMECGLVTNGFQYAKYAGDIRATCKFVRFSVDAANSGTYARLHGVTAGCWSNLLINIDDCARAGSPDVGMAFLVHPENYTEVYGFCILGRELGVDYVQIRPVWTPQFSLSRKIIQSVMQQVRKYASQFDIPTIYVRMDRFEEILNNSHGFRQCLASPLVGVIGADLNVYLCCQTRGQEDTAFGNLATQGFREIWLGERRRKVVEHIDVSRCPPCRYRTYNITLNELKEADHINFL